MGRSGMRLAVWISVLAIGAGGCAQGLQGNGQYSGNVRTVADADIEIKGLPDGKKTDVDVIAGNAIADIQRYWTEQFPKVFNGRRYEGPKGGLYSVDPSVNQDVPCVSSPSQIRGNAFYCPPKDVVAWDRVDLFPSLKEKFSPFLIAMVLAHEWGHVIQAKSGVEPARTIVRETQADCYAGGWTRSTLEGQAPHFQIERAELDNALAGYLLFRDPIGAAASDQDAHGNGFDRISAFQEGFEQGPVHCAKFTDDRNFTEIRFTDPTDLGRGGNLPLDDQPNEPGAITAGFTDLNSTWPGLFKDLFGKDLSKPRAEQYAEGDNVTCGGSPVRQGVLYCASNNTIFYDTEALRNVSTKTKDSDYAPMTLAGIAYAQAVETQASRSTAGKGGLLRAICLDGGYTAVVTRRSPQDRGLRLSPGDLDEAIQSLLFYAGLDNFFGARGTSGFDRVQAYRQGFNDAKSCT